MPTIDPQQLSGKDRYRLLVDSIVPRPIAWVTTLNEASLDGKASVNLAPFSYFMGVTSTPPALAISIGARTPPKDTFRNLERSREAVVHIVPPEKLEVVNQTGGEYGHGVSEVEQLELATVPSDRVAPPRLELADVALECRLLQVVPIGSPGASVLPPRGGANLCVLEVVVAHVKDAVAQEDGLPDPRKLRAVARLGERFYLRGDNWNLAELERPSVPEALGIEKG